MESDEVQQANGNAGGGFPDRSLIDLSRDPTPGEPDHLAPDDAGDRPLIDLSRDPTPGVPDHAVPDDEDGSDDGKADGQ
ncbi:MAG: hypothetical protein ACJ73E_00060 [Mycobacteriales bacterium]